MKLDPLFCCLRFYNYRKVVLYSFFSLWGSRLTSDAKKRARIKFRCSTPKTSEWLELLESASSAEEAPSLSVLRDKAMLALVVRRLVTGDPRARHLTVQHLSRYDPQLPRALVMVRVFLV